MSYEIVMYSKVCCSKFALVYKTLACLDTESVLTSITDKKTTRIEICFHFIRIFKDIIISYINV